MKLHRPIEILQNGTDSFKELVTVYLGILTICSIAYSFFEHKDLFTSFWWSIVTALTVGYGDTYPVTVAGKIVAIILMHTITLFIIPIIVARMATRVIHNKDEFTDGEQREMMTLLRKIVKKEEAKQDDK